jgi:DNA-binding response OmpR family regulator
MNTQTLPEAALPELKQSHVVVIVDDELQVLAALRRLLRREPYEIMTTDRPEVAYEWVVDRQASLLITDQRMPEVMGTDLLERVYRDAPGTERIMLTAHPDTQTVVQRLTHRVSRLITKPWNDEELKRTIRSILHEKETGASGRPASLRFGEDEEAGPPPRDFVETMIRIDCRDRTQDEVLARIFPAMATPEAFESGVAVLLEGFQGLRGSQGDLLRELLRQTAVFNVPVSLVDASGTAAGFLETLGGPELLVLYGPRPGDPPGRKVLVVEDHPESLAIFRYLIESVGHECAAAGSAEEAVRRLDLDAFDAVVLDLDLRDAGAITVARHLADRGMEVRIVPISSFLGRADVAARKGIAKPCHLKDFFDAISSSP